jgi:hypothetical protein
MNSGDECDAVLSGGNLLAYGRKLCTSFNVHEWARIFLRNVVKYVPGYTASYPRRLLILRCENKSRRPLSFICLFYRSNDVLFVRLWMEAYCFKRSVSMSLITVLFRSDLVSLHTISIWQDWTAWGHNGAGAVLVFLTEKINAKSVGQDIW